jgi:ATP-dependent Clp protease ATP-binding subunit ClpC
LPSEQSGSAEGVLYGVIPEGIGTHGSPQALLPSAWALPSAVRAYRHHRGELLYRARAGREPPELRPVVLMLDVSPACRVEPIASVLRPAAYVLAKTLLEARQPCFLLLLGEKLDVRSLQHPLDLFEVLAARSDGAIDVGASIGRGQALRETLRRPESALSPVLVLLTHTFFGAEDGHLPLQPHLRALFAEYPNLSRSPPWRHHCERWVSLPARSAPDVVSSIAELLA